MVRKNTDKLSYVFLPCKQGPQSGLPSVHSAPGPACNAFSALQGQGESVGRLKGDQYGDNVLNLEIQGANLFGTTIT